MNNNNNKPNYFRIKEMIMVSSLTISTITDTEFEPAIVTNWAEVIQESICSMQYLPVEVIADVLSMAYTCTSEETQTYQFMQISDSEMEAIMNKHDCN